MGSRGPISEQKPTLNFKIGVPTPPTWLDDDARAEYRRVVKVLAENPGHLQQVDMATLCTYAQAFSDVKRLTLKVREQGESLVGEKGGSYLNPICSALSQAHNRQREAAAKLGFSPIDRARAGTKGAKERSDHPVSGYIGGE